MTSPANGCEYLLLYTAMVNGSLGGKLHLHPVHSTLIRTEIAVLNKLLYFFKTKTDHCIKKDYKTQVGEYYLQFQNMYSYILPERSSNYTVY